MDLSFSLPVPTDPAALPDADMASLVAQFAERQADSATARIQAALTDGETPAEAPAEDRPLAPATGAFNAGMATRLIAWQQT